MIAANTFELLVEAVRRRTGFEPQMAEAAIEATLEAIASGFPADAVGAAAEQLPARAARCLRRHSYRGDPISADELYRRVAEREGVSLGFAREHLLVVGEVLAEALVGTEGASLCRLMPELFRVRENTPPVVHESAVRAHSTLADGRPGSTHPVSESGPTTRVVVDEDETTLARGRPGSRRPLSYGGNR